MIRAFRPAARAVRWSPRTAARRARLRRTRRRVRGHAGRRGAAARLRARGRLRRGRHVHVGDPYRFLPTLGEMDLHLVGEGRHEELYAKLGAHVLEHQGVRGIAFAVWAPSARSVSVVGDFNSWDGRLNPMRSLGSSGIWELFLPGVGVGHQLQVRDPHADRRDPPEGRPARVRDRDAAARRPRSSTSPRTSGPTRRGSPERARDRAARRADLGLRGPSRLVAARTRSRATARSPTSSWPTSSAAYAKDMGFTHIELMPVMAHPFSGSWGYQVTGYFAPTPRYGSPDEFRAFVDRLHQAGLGVILDWVPAHFPRDDFALARFDGTALYEHEDPRRGAHPDWGTLVFNYGRNEVRNFLLAERPVLAARVPRRRHPRRRRRLDALPRLLARGGPVGAERVRRQRGPRRRQLPQGVQRGRPRRRSRA